MNVSKIKAVYYSATGNTEKVVLELAGQLSSHMGIPVEACDFTLPEERRGTRSYERPELVVFGMPVYAGRLPNKLLSYIQDSFHADGALAIPVVTFGNRSFDDGLVELVDGLEGNGFHTVAAAAFSCRHAFSDRIAPGRPDAQDREQLRRFAAMAAEKIAGLTAVPEPISVRGNHPVGPYYTPLGEDGKPAAFLKAKPKTREEDCDRCGVCVRVCPMHAVSEEDPSLVPGICIKCQACVRKCHAHAKYFDDPAFLSHVRMLEAHYTRRAEPELFL